MIDEKVKTNCIRIVELIQKYEKISDKLRTPKEDTHSIFYGFNRIHNLMEDSRKERGDFCANWNDGDNLVIFEKKNHNNYLVTLNPGNTLVKIDNYASDLQSTSIEKLRLGPWVERFEKYLVDYEIEIGNLIQQQQDIQHNMKFGDIDF